ncbi:MAG: hypothetical protein RL367_2721 [Pseudomonadota bacterium]|jgi:hypothetical protein
MTDIDRESYLEDEDRLPWLEAVENDEEEEGLSGSKLLGLILAGLAVLAIGFGAYHWLNKQGDNGTNADGTLIAAPEGDYKQKPSEPGGMKVPGQGDAAFNVSEGGESNGKLAVNGGPEAPVAGIKVNPAAATPVAEGKAGVTTVVPPATAPAAAPAGGGALIQLGAYGSQATADAGWAAAVRAHPALASLTKVVQATQFGKGTVYRLRANAGNAANAAAMCAKVSPCMVVH